MSVPTLFFSAFEPSGDDLAAALIKHVLQQQPTAKVYAFGGPKMAAAGAELVEQTTEKPVMGADALAEIKAHKARLKRFKAWLKEHPIDGLVPVDSPGANWSICAAFREVQPKSRIVHLVGPQIWAWGTWRIRKLRRLTDHVLCLLPFEPAWFGERGVAGTFVGHPLYETEPEIDLSGLPTDGGVPGSSSPKTTSPKRIVILPGSRASEIHRNVPLMMKVVNQINERLDQPIDWLVALRTPEDQPRYEAAGGHVARARDDSGTSFTMVHGRTDDAIDWSEAVLAVSGTVTLQVAARHRAQVAMFEGPNLQWYLFGQFIIRTRTFTLPNLIHEWMSRAQQAAGQAAEGETPIPLRAIPEIIPCLGRFEPVAEALEELLSDPSAAVAQQEAAARIRAEFEAVPFGPTAASVLWEQVLVAR